ncbi:MAG: hypothetical protein BroJett003_19910 [Planctomycetota bacterium]|nr:MAG: hypothetical protein BroJett003_19910 [Planctomycetota bacterium]
MTAGYFCGFLSVILGSGVDGPPAGQADRGAASSGEAEISAHRWFNNPVFKLKDDRDVLLFFFTLGANEAGKESLRTAEKLNRLCDNPKLVVIGLTTAPASQVERFIKQHHIRFTVGSGSRSATAFRVEKFPTVLRIDRRSPASDEPSLHIVQTVAWVSLNGEAIDRLVDATAASTDSASLPTSGEGNPWTRRFSSLQEMDVIDLMNFIEDVESDREYQGWSRAAAVRVLSESAPKEDFLEFAAARLAVESNARVRCNLKYYTDVVSGLRKDDEGQSVSAKAFLAFRDDPEQESWGPVRAYQALGEQERGNGRRLLEMYHGHFADDPANTLVRRMVVEDLWHRCTDDIQVRNALMEVISMDPDASIRMIAAMGLTKRCATGDIEVAEFLEAMAEIEPNLKGTRPMLEYAAGRIRTGETHADDLPVASP